MILLALGKISSYASGGYANAPNAAQTIVLAFLLTQQLRTTHTLPLAILLLAAFNFELLQSYWANTSLFVFLRHVIQCARHCSNRELACRHKISIHTSYIHMYVRANRFFSKDEGKTTAEVHGA